MITQTYTLDLIPHGEPLIVHASQYDTESRTLVFNLVKEGVAFDATGMSASIRGTKPDNTGFMYAMTVSGTSVSIDIKDQMTAVAGNVPCEVLIADANGSLGTANFTLRVEKSALDDETVISETDIPVFEELVTQASNYASQASSSASAAAAAMDDVAYQATSSTALSSATQATLYSDQAKTAPIAPNTSTEAVWDANGNRLDNILADLDTTPTSGSTKPVTSGGIRTAIDEVTVRYESTATLTNMTSSLNRISQRCGVNVLSLNLTPTTTFSAYESNRIVVPEKYRTASSVNVFAATLIGSSVEMVQWQVLTDGSVRSGVSIAANTNFRVTLVYA